MTKKEATTQFCPGCGEEVLFYAVRTPNGFELRCALCWATLGFKPSEHSAERTLHGL